MATNSVPKALACASVPQVLTYLGARATELFCKDRKGILGMAAKTIRDTKYPTPYMRIAEENVEYK